MSSSFQIFTLTLILSLACHVEGYKDGTKELVFLQTLWRHGDRSPAGTFPTDPYQEDSWTFGGTGWGQLSPAGMRQHLNLGKLLRKRYVDGYGFLSKKYNSKEIYVRSTDKNRTMISAMSNMLGQYGQDDNSSVAGLDYPDIEGWPRGFVPIAVHTVDDDTDFLVNMESICPLREKVWNLAKASDEVVKFVASDEVRSVLGNLTKFCGAPVNIDNLWIVTDALYIEQIYFNDTLRQRNSWYSDELYGRADAVNDRAQLLQNGIFQKSPNIVNGHDVGLLTRKLRGGPLLNNFVMHMNLKLGCRGQTSLNCTWINNLRHYIYSAHDTTMYAFFSSLLIEQYVVKPAGAYPLYSAAVLLELYVDSSDLKPYFKMVYHEQEGAGFKDVTMGIQGCPQDSSYCDLEVLREFAKSVAPDEPIEQWCYADLEGKMAGFKGLNFVVAVIGVLCLFLY